MCCHDSIINRLSMTQDLKYVRYKWFGNILQSIKGFYLSDWELAVTCRHSGSIVLDLLYFLPHAQAWFIQSVISSQLSSCDKHFCCLPHAPTWWGNIRNNPRQNQNCFYSESTKLFFLFVWSDWLHFLFKLCLLFLPTPHPSASLGPCVCHA